MIYFRMKTFRWLHSARFGRTRIQSRHVAAPSTGVSGERAAAPPKRHRGWRRFVTVLLVILVVAGIGRAVLPWSVRKYVNRALERNQLYSGTIGQVQVHLWHGAYSIQNIQLSKVTGNVPVPFFSAKRVELAMQWDALFHGRLVGQIVMDQPEINFVDASDKGESQTGADAPWLQMIQGLFPFTINRAVVQDGSVHFRFFESQKPVDVYISQVQGAIDNLSNIKRELNPLVATVQATGLVMDQAKIQFKMTLDPFSYRPTFHLALRLIGLDVTKLNDVALTYGKFDFKRGWFDLVVEADAKEGLISGYVKPLFRNLKTFSLTQDIKEDNALQFFWQALVGAVTTVFKNQPRDQFGTLVPFSGDLSSSTTTDIFATVANVLRNAFVRAYLPRLQGGQEEVGGLEFAPPDLGSALSSTDVTSQ